MRLGHSLLVIPVLALLALGCGPRHCMSHHGEPCRGGKAGMAMMMHDCGPESCTYGNKCYSGGAVSSNDGVCQACSAGKWVARERMCPSTPGCSHEHGPCHEHGGLPSRVAMGTAVRAANRHLATVITSIRTTTESFHTALRLSRRAVTRRTAVGRRTEKSQLFTCVVRMPVCYRTLWSQIPRSDEVNTMSIAQPERSR